MRYSLVAITALPLLASAADPELLIDRTLTHKCTRSTKNGDTINAHYRGTLQSTGTQFDASYDRGQPLSFQLGAGRVIKGWDLGLLDMCPGDKRTLTIPPELGYGSRAMGPIPAGSTLVFETELVSIKGVADEERVVVPKEDLSPKEEKVSGVKTADTYMAEAEEDFEAKVAQENAAAAAAGAAADNAKSVAGKATDSAASAASVATDAAGSAAAAAAESAKSATDAAGSVISKATDSAASAASVATDAAGSAAAAAAESIKSVAGKAGSAASSATDAAGSAAADAAESAKSAAGKATDSAASAATAATDAAGSAAAAAGGSAKGAAAKVQEAVGGDAESENPEDEVVQELKEQSHPKDEL